jgi:hypothetical protein
MVGFINRSWLKSSRAVSIAAGGSIHSLGDPIWCSRNQSFGASSLRWSPSQGVPSSEHHHELTQQLTMPGPTLSSAPSHKGKNRIGSVPDFIIPSIKSPLDNLSIQASFIQVPATCLTRRMHPVCLSTCLTLRTRPLSFLELECPLVVSENKDLSTGQFLLLFNVLQPYYQVGGFSEVGQFLPISLRKKS